MGSTTPIGGDTPLQNDNSNKIKPVMNKISALAVVIIAAVGVAAAGAGIAAGVATTIAVMPILVGTLAGAAVGIGLAAVGLKVAELVKNKFFKSANLSQNIINDGKEVKSSGGGQDQTEEQGVEVSVKSSPLKTDNNILDFLTDSNEKKLFLQVLEETNNFCENSLKEAIDEYSVDDRDLILSIKQLNTYLIKILNLLDKSGNNREDVFHVLHKPIKGFNDKIKLVNHPNKELAGIQNNWKQFISNIDVINNNDKVQTLLSVNCTEELETDLPDFEYDAPDESDEIFEEDLEFAIKTANDLIPTKIKAFEDNKKIQNDFSEKFKNFSNYIHELEASVDSSTGADFIDDQYYISLHDISELLDGLLKLVDIPVDANFDSDLFEYKVSVFSTFMNNLKNDESFSKLSKDWERDKKEMDKFISMGIGRFEESKELYEKYINKHNEFLIELINYGYSNQML